MKLVSMRNRGRLSACIIAALGVVAGGFAAAQPPADRPITTAIADASIRFASVDIFADSGTDALAAYQIEITAEIKGGTVSLVGVEGGDPAATRGAFAEPPIYDPEALTHSRIVLAAYTARDVKDLPSGRVRIARLHVQIEHAAGDATGAEAGNGAGEGAGNVAAANQPTNVNPTYRVRVIAAGRADGTRIAAEFEAVPGDQR